jgi:DnaK suppressor protein
MDPERARELLARERERIERLLSRRGPTDDGEPSADLEHLADFATDLTEDELELSLSETLRAELAALERAERRLEEGTYGLSVESGKPIPDERLEAYPIAERTAEEQQRLEGSQLAG